MASLPGPFNRSLTVSPLFSDLDLQALIEHFLRVRVDQLDKEIGDIEREMVGKFGKNEVGWPIGSTEESPAPNRFQVPVWQMFDGVGNLFGNDPTRNLEKTNERTLLKRELDELLGMAKRTAEREGQLDMGLCQFGGIRQGYR